MKDTRWLGMVSKWNDAKGCGFINCNGEDIFCHYSAIMGDGFKTLEIGEFVYFRLENGRAGLQAFDIMRGRVK